MIFSINVSIEPGQCPINVRYCESTVAVYGQSLEETRGRESGANTPNWEGCAFSPKRTLIKDRFGSRPDYGRQYLELGNRLMCDPYVARQEKC